MSSRNKSRVITVYSPKSGCGQTTLAVNLAAELARTTGETVALVNANREGQSDIHNLLGLPPGKGLGQLVPLLDHLEPQLVKGYLLSHSAGIDFFQAVSNSNEEEKIQTSNLEKAIKCIAELYPYLIVDSGRSFSKMDLLIFDLSNLILLPVIADLLSLARVKQCLENFAYYHYPLSLLKSVLNMKTTEASLTKATLESFLGQPLFFEIPFDPELSVGSFNPKTPMVLSNSRSPFARAINTLVSRLTNEENIYLETSDLTDRVKKIEKKNSDSTVDLISLKNHLRGKLLKELNLRSLNLRAVDSQDLIKRTIERLLADEEIPSSSRNLRAELANQLLDEVLGLGPLQPFLRDPSISEIMTIGPDKIYIERAGKITLTGVSFVDEEQMMSAVERIVSPIGRRIDESMPLCDARLKDGSRVNIVIPPLALDGPAITIRKFMERKLNVGDLVKTGSLSKEMGEFLRICVLLQKNIIVSGGTGSGKTTLLNILSSFIPADERIVTIEDSAELKLQQEHIVRLESRPANIEGGGEISIRRLVINALRMRPDRIVVGECRGGEALDMLQAMNTGHDGSLTTVHANSSRDVLTRLETMVLMSGVDLPVRVVREQIKGAVDIIVHQARFADGSRRVTSVTEITGMEGETITTQDIFAFRQTGVDGEGKIIGNFMPTGVMPTFVEQVKIAGIEFDLGIFVRKD